MSSSNIIKSDSSDKKVFEEYSFETISFDESPAAEEVAAPAFVSFLETIMGDTSSDARTEPSGEPDEDAAEPETEEPEPLPEAPPGISEEVHLQEIRESYEKGLEEGNRQAERGLSNVFKALRDSVEKMARLRVHILRESEEDLLKLAVMIAKKIINQEITTDRLILAKVVSAAVTSVSDRDEIVIRLNPEDHRLVSAHRHLYLDGCGDERLVELKVDDSVTPGGCIVDTAMGEIDARTDVQVDEIFRRLLEEKALLMDPPADLPAEREHHAYEER